MTKALGRPFGWMRNEFSILSRKGRRLWILALIVLTLGPVAMTLVRESEYTASVDVFATETGPGPSTLESYVDEVLEGSEFRKEVEASPSVPVDDPLSGVELSTPRSTPDAVVLSAEARTPDDAELTVRIIGSQVVAAASAESRSAIRGRLDQLEEERDGLTQELSSASSASAVEIQERIDELTTDVDALEARSETPPLVLGEVEAPGFDAVPDEIIDALPGTFPARPSPLWAGLVGLLLWLGIFSLTRYLLQLRRRPESDGGETQ